MEVRRCSQGARGCDLGDRVGRMLDLRFAGDKSLFASTASEITLATPNIDYADRIILQNTVSMYVDSGASPCRSGTGCDASCAASGDFFWGEYVYRIGPLRLDQ